MTIDRRRFEDGGLILFVVLVTIATGLVVSSFAGALLWSTLAAILFQPLYRRLLARNPKRENRAAGLTMKAVILANEQKLYMRLCSLSVFWKIWNETKQNKGLYEEMSIHRFKASLLFGAWFTTCCIPPILGISSCSLPLSTSAPIPSKFHLLKYERREEKKRKEDK